MKKWLQIHVANILWQLSLGFYPGADIYLLDPCRNNDKLCVYPDFNPCVEIAMNTFQNYIQ